MTDSASNFDFLRDEWSFLYADAVAAERNARAQPRAACFYARFTLEKAVHWLYDHDSYLQRPYEQNLGALLHERTFKDNLRPGLFAKFRVLLINGNRAAHDDAPITASDALHTVKELFHVLYWLARSYSRDAGRLPAVSFDLALIPRSEDEAPKQDLNAEQIQRLQEKLEAQDAVLAGREEELRRSKEQIAALQKEMQAIKARNELVPDPHDYSEAETRDYLIDLLLKEAGWPLDRPEDREYPVTGMPNPPSTSGKGSVDYVLWGDDGLPLAVVEAKRTKKDPRIGQQQASLYADCLERQFGRRPVIFYTNGYVIWLWDDVRYPPRQVAGFYKKDELEHLIQQRTERQPLAKATINAAITNRYYQKEAIRRVCEAFTAHKRRALLVMATGTGKTRTAISIVDLLMRAGWVKRVLFLADRNALVRQARNAFKAHLPTVSPVNLVKEKDKLSSRVILSTYPTMMNSINATKEGQRLFSPGHFDLIIIDEAHRSVYQKYGAIFAYFDALLLGLTATPRDEVDRNTYKLFGLHKGNPTYYYELDEAVADEYLVPPKTYDVPLKFQREGVRYHELSEDEKEAYELTFFDEETGEIPDQIGSAALNLWLFNTDTVDQVLTLLMEKGLHVEGGDRLGKTIIFARNHKHALFIQKRFDENYPHLAGKFARVIDSHDPYADSLLDAFCVKDKNPIVAISVDMLDTGIDVPEILNLVYFKPVRSKTKFHQMLGRGTRLCEHLFGPDQHKEYFYVFDFCQNFEFFDQHPDGAPASVPESMASKTFKLRLSLAARLDGEATEEEQALRNAVLDLLHEQVRHMNPENFVVRPKRFLVDIYTDRDQWNHLTSEDRKEIAENLAGLPTELDADDEFARRFDFLLLNLQIAALEKSPAIETLRDKVKEMAFQLEGKASIPAVECELELLHEVQTDTYWQDVTLPMLETIRKRLRLLIKFIDRDQQHIVYTDFTDELGLVTEVTMPAFANAESRRQYRRKVEQYIRANEKHITIYKLKNNQPLTPSDLAELERILFESEEVGGREKFSQTFNHEGTLGVFIRRLVGLDQNAAKAAFGDYLTDSTLTANQIHFINQIINYLTQNGVMDPGLLYEPPFTEIHSNGLDGVFDDAEANKIVGIIQSINANAA